MNRSETAALRRIGQLQLEVLLWLGECYGLKAHAKSSSGFQRYAGISPHDVGAMVGAVERIKDQRKKAEANIRSKNADSETVIAMGEGRPFVQWKAEAFLGRPPTRSESANLSDALTKLQRRGLVYLNDGTRGEGKKPRVHSVRLTKMGVSVAARTFAEEVRAKEAAFTERLERNMALAEICAPDGANGDKT